MWFLFCDAKSIEVENRNTQGYKDALEKYIASKENYYSIDRILDRVNLLVNGLDRFSELNDTLKTSILENIDDKEFLKQIVIHPNSPNKLRKLSIANIHDDKFLFEQAVKHFPTYGDNMRDYGSLVLSTSIKRAAVNQIQSEIILKNIVMEPFMDSAVNDAAIKKITDQDFHKALVLKSKSIAKTKAAIWQITDKEFLEDLIDDRSKHTYRNALLNSINERLRVLNRE